MRSESNHTSLGGIRVSPHRYNVTIYIIANKANKANKGKIYMKVPKKLCDGGGMP
jgi:hypothetical protein